MSCDSQGESWKKKQYKTLFKKVTKDIFKGKAMCAVIKIITMLTQEIARLESHELEIIEESYMK